MHEPTPTVVPKKSLTNGKFAGLGRFLRQPLVIVAILYFVGNGLRFCTIRITEWDQVYMRAAHQLLEGRADLYQATRQTPHVFAYPPFMALLAVPFSYLGHTAGRLVWYLINVVAVVLMWNWAWIGSGGVTSTECRVRNEEEQSLVPPLHSAPCTLHSAQTSRGRYSILFLGLACGMRFVQDGIDHQQTDVVIAALLLGGCVAMLRSRTLTAATAIGLAAAMKCTPLLFVGYFLWRRKWLPAAWVIVLAVICNLLPNLVSAAPPGAPGGWWAGLWIHNLIQPMADPNYRPGDWYSSVIFNQSISGAMYRMFVSHWAIIRHSVVPIDRLNPMSPRTLKYLTDAVELGLMFLALLAFMKSRRDPQPAQGRPPMLSLEYSVVLLLMLMFSPMSSKPHFCTMLLPGFCLARIAVERRDQLAMFFVVAAILAGNVVIPNFFGSIVGDLALWYGILTWSALLLLFGCYAAMMRPVPPPASAAL